MYARATIPGTSGSSVTLSYPYPKLLEVLYDSHTLTRNPQILQNITLEFRVNLIFASCVVGNCNILQGLRSARPLRSRKEEFQVKISTKCEGGREKRPMI